MLHRSWLSILSRQSYAVNNSETRVGLFVNRTVKGLYQNVRNFHHEPAVQSRGNFPLIIIVNPHCDIDGSTQQILCQRQVSFAKSTQEALEILRPFDDLRLIITHAADVNAVLEALVSIDDSAPLNYLIMLGPQSNKDVTLDDLLRNH